VILGFLTAAAFLLTAGKFVTRRLRWRKADALFRRIHPFAAGAFLLLAAIHPLLTLPLLPQRPAAMPVTGILLLIGAALALGSHVFAKKLGARWLTLHRFASLLILLCLIGHVIVGFSSLAAYRQNVAAIRIEPAVLSDVTDGVYEGACDVGYIRASVRVTVTGGQLSDVTLLEHRTERGQAAERIPADVLTAQSLDVDTVTGATNSSKVILKAIENALSQGISRDAQKS
jgi:uncharacterized protein with FMN-binding domain